LARPIDRILVVVAEISPGWETDLEILRLTGSVITTNPDYLIIRTPHNPDYHWGNCLMVTAADSVDDAHGWVSNFKDAFPDSDWIAIGLPTMPTNTEAWLSLGVELEQLDVLSTKSVPKSSARPDGYNCRIFEPEDWEKLVRSELTENQRTGDYDPDVYERFVRGNMKSRMQLSDQGDAAWFGAFADGKLVAHLGIIRCGVRGRYQAVETHPEHRRRGLASHLLGLAAQWSAARGCTEWVIVTEATNDAGRVYRRAGFEPDIASVAAYKKPEISK